LAQAVLHDRELLGRLEQPTDAARLRIAHLGCKGIPSRGGTERVVEALAVRQAAAGHDVTVYGSRLVCPNERAYRGVRVIAMPTVRAKYAGPVLLQVACAAHALRQHFDVVHVHGAENAFVLPLAGSVGEAATILTAHGGARGVCDKWGRTAKAAMRAVEAIAVRGPDISTSVAEAHAEIMSRRYQRPVCHIPNGIEVGAVDRISARQLLRAHGVQGRYVLFAAARIDPTKGCHTLIAAYRGLTTPPPLVVLGDLFHARGYEQTLRAAAEGLPVVFIPRVQDKATVMGVVAESELFVFPSMLEGMSMMLLEALALGVPTVASDIPENMAILPAEVATFHAGDGRSLLSAVQECLSLTQTARRERAEAARRTVLARHDWDAIAQQYERLYRQAIAQSRERRRLRLHAQ